MNNERLGEIDDATRDYYQNGETLLARVLAATRGRKMPRKSSISASEAIDKALAEGGEHG